MASRADQGVRDAELSTKASGAKADVPAHAGGIAGLIERVLALRPVRVFFHYNSENGPLLASGMSNQAVFALFAALWFAFSVAGFIIKGNTQLQSSLFRALNSVVPGLIGYDGSTGVIKSSVLLNTTALSVSGIIALVGILFTAVGFLATLRTAIRVMFALPGPTTNFAILKLKDIGLAIAFGAVILLTAVISFISTSAIDAAFAVLGVPPASAAATVLATAVGAVLIFAIDSVTLAGAFRILSGIKVPGGRLRTGAIIGGAGLAALQTVGTSLLGVSKNNPLLAGFAVILGLLIYFNLVCQVILLAASWIAVGMKDAHIDPRSLSRDQLEVETARELEAARRLVATANKRTLQQHVRDASGLRRLRLARMLKNELRAEARRRVSVPTASELQARIEERDRAQSPDDARRAAPISAADAAPAESGTDTARVEPPGRAR